MSSRAAPRDPQGAGAVLMVRPARFAFNPQTAASNAFQAPAGRQAAGDEGPDAQTCAAREFDGLVDALQRVGVEVVVAADSATPEKPDAVFPNNWVSFHRDGTVVLYPMLAVNRRLERREEILAPLAGRFVITAVLDLSHHENAGKFLEGTGSLVLDRIYRNAYAGLSARTDASVLEEFCRKLHYESVSFDAVGADGRPIYHTNVFMAIGTGFAVLCSDAITEAGQRAAVLGRLRATGREVIEITLQQMQQFAGNLLELAAPGGAVVALSQGAWRSFEPAQRRRLEHHAALAIADIPTIERLGGGGVRCMLAEIHLQPRPAP